MTQKLQNLIKLLLELHRELLDLERGRYENKHGQILNNNDYFNLVVNHENFQWLRSLSQVISLIDEEAERADIDKEKISRFLAELEDMLAEKSENDFSVRYQKGIIGNKNIAGINRQIKLEIENLKSSFYDPLL
jgi:hypothetical protein